MNEFFDPAWSPTRVHAWRVGYAVAARAQELLDEGRELTPELLAEVVAFHARRGLIAHAAELEADIQAEHRLLNAENCLLMDLIYGEGTEGVTIEGLEGSDKDSLLDALEVIREASK